MSKVKAILGALVVGVVAYGVAAPYITVYQIKEAAEKRDAVALSEHIDFPSVRQSLKDQMNASIAQKIGSDQAMQDSFLGSLGKQVGGLFVDKVVEVYVTPSGIRQLMLGEKPKVLEVEVPAAESGEKPEPSEKPLSHSSMRYVSLDRFVVYHKNKAGKEAQFVLHRQGIQWKLSEIVLPQE
jgi:hypothetical protein